MNRSEFFARKVKVECLTALLVRYGFQAEVVKEMTDKEWGLAAHAARVKPPSTTTRQLVIEKLLEYEREQLERAS